MKNENENNALAVADNQSLIELDNDLMLGFTPKTQEEFELIRDLLDTAAALDGLELPRVTSQTLAKDGEVFDIVDAVQTTINVEVKTETGTKIVPKVVVNFIITSPNYELAVVMKDGNSINLQYAQFFSKFKAIGKPQRKNGYNFVEATWMPKKVGNHPVILQKVQTEKLIGQGKAK